MKVNISDVKIGDTIHVYDMSPNYPLIYSVDVTRKNEVEPGIFDVHDEVLIDTDYCTIFTDLTECIDLIRKSNFISEFDKSSINWYFDFLKYAINKKQIVYVIRERKYGLKDRYLDESVITGIYYDGKWKIKTKSKDKYITTMHYASSLGLRIFFNKDNAIKKLSTLKGGLN